MPTGILGDPKNCPEHKVMTKLWKKFRIRYRTIKKYCIILHHLAISNLFYEYYVNFPQANYLNVKCWVTFIQNKLDLFQLFGKTWWIINTKVLVLSWHLFSLSVKHVKSSGLKLLPVTNTSRTPTRRKTVEALTRDGSATEAQNAGVRPHYASVCIIPDYSLQSV
jgi:hypothetical protein